MAEEVWTPQAVVLGAGNYPSHHIPLALMRECPRVVCCDGAAQDYIQREGRLPWRIVGDGDSIPAALKAQCRDILFLESEQETNDQTKATRL
ncbi:MAG: thiamine diphosphokinase, partial [Bacteroidaceae bacterium]|nr:thiamine diphosphokinase [Bacteroidaceae bacterium]